MKEDLSIEQILKSIKQVILGRSHDSIKPKAFSQESNLDEGDEDAYELTNLAPEDLKGEEDSFPENLGQAASQKNEKEQDVSSSLLSEKSAKEAMQHFASIKQSVGRQQNAHQTISPGTNKTVEDLTIEIMKPYLSQWLDENLPRIVKNLVEQEIKKLISDENNTNRNN
jgi:cell pole-organizing protein PopZ